MGSETPSFLRSGRSRTERQTEQATSKEHIIHITSSHFSVLISTIGIGHKFFFSHHEKANR
jgi:hypothetical protein